MSDPDWDLSVYCRIRWYKVLRPPPFHVGHRDDRGPISLAGPGPPKTLRRLCICHSPKLQTNQKLACCHILTLLIQVMHPWDWLQWSLSHFNVWHSAGMHLSW